MLQDLERFLFAPEGGGWAYTYVQRPDLFSLLSVVGLVTPLLLQWRRTESQIETRPVKVVAQWLAAALVVQWVVLAIAPFSLTSKLESVSANGFYTVSKEYSAANLLRHFNTITVTLPMHVQANLPGKVLLFHLLRMLSERPEILAAMLVILSTLGGLLVYVVVWQWFQNRRTAAVAAIFYLLFPARIWFLPLLNTVSPLFMLVSLALAGAWARTGVTAYAAALGPSLYALAIFDPLPLAAGLCGLAALPRQLERRVSRVQPTTFAVIVVAGWLATHAAVVGVFGFDLLSAYRFAIHNASTFNLEQQRPYWFWAGHNLKDFSIAIGVAQTLVVAFGVRRWLEGPAAAICVSIVACLLIVDALGVNRGEVQRLWLFLGVLFQILAAHSCGHNRRIVAAVIGLSAAQLVLCMRSIAWIVP